MSRLSHQDLFGDLHLEEELSPEQITANLQVLRDYIYNGIGTIPSHLDARDQYDIPFEDEERIIHSDIASALDEPTGDGTTTYGDKVGGTLDSRVELYARYAQKVSTMILEVAENIFQKEEVKAIVDEVKTFEALEQIPEKSVLNDRLIELKQRIAALKPDQAMAA